MKVIPIVNLESDPTPSPLDGAPPVVYWHRSGSARSARPMGLLTGWSALGLLVRSTGARRWVWDWRGKDGVKHRRQYDVRTFAEAQKKLMDDRMSLEAGVELELAPITPEGGATVSELIGKYIAHISTSVRPKVGVQRRPRYIERVKHELQALGAVLGRRAVSSITAGDLEGFLDRYSDRPGAMLWWEVQLSAVFDFAVRRDFCARSPMVNVQRRGSSKERHKFLDETELRLGLPLIADLSYPYGDVVMIALLTGRRAEAIVKARWSEFRDGLWELPEKRSKGRRDGHMVPLTKTGLAILERAAAHKVGAGEFVFHGPKLDRPIANMKGAVKKLRDAMAPATAARLEPEQRSPFQFHDTKRTVGTSLEKLFAPDAVIKEVLDHSRKGDRGVSSGYMGAFRDTTHRLAALREWLDKLDQFFNVFCSPQLMVPCGRPPL